MFVVKKHFYFVLLLYHYIPYVPCSDEGNVHLRNGDLDQAISCYDRALQLGDPEQEGVLLVMRGTALLQRAYLYRMRQRDVLQVAESVLPYSESIRACMDVFYSSSLALPIK